MGLGLGISVDWASLVPYYAKVASAFAARVKADGGTVENAACLKKDLKVLNPTPPPAFTGLLNTYSGAAAAYSLRLLDNTYTGNAIKVRRSSDNAEQDIAFVNNELDTASLETFASGTDAFVTTWYDQSGNDYNVTQTTASKQPKIVLSGSTITTNSKPTIEFNGTTSYLFNPLQLVDDATSAFISTAFSTTRSALQYVLEMPRDTGGSRGFDVRTISSTNILSGLLTENPVVSTNATGTFNNASGNLNLVMASFDEAIATNNHQIFGNGALVGQATNGGTDIHNKNTGINLGVFSNDTSNGYLLGTISEAFVYKSNQLSNRTGIETNINDFYSIY